MWMSWAMLREMSRAGMVIGGHTVSHVVLSNASPGRQREEIAGCRNRIAAELSQPMKCFSYPVGGPDAFDTQTKRALAEAGVEFAFSYYGGFRHFDEWDSLDIRRIPVEAGHSDRWFRSSVSLPTVFA